jgi:hypothetical protein
MSYQDGNTAQEEAGIAELELNKESLHDLDVDGSNVKGGAGVIAAAPVAQANPNLNPGVIRATTASGTSVI